MTRLLIVIAIALLMVSVALGWMMRVYLPGVTLAEIFLVMSLVPRLVAGAILVTMVVGAVGGFRRNVLCVQFVAIIAVLLGVLGAVHGELTTHFGTLIDNVINFTTLAPMRIESLAILVLGLFGALPGLGIHHVRGGVRQG